GVSWVLQATGMLNICNSIRFIDNNNGWIAATAGKIVHTTNGGTTWTQQTSGVATSMLSVDFVDANNGWVVGASGVILHTTNAGATWTSQASGTTANLNCVRFTGSHTGWIVGNYGIILRTFDGGVNWETQVSATGTDATKNLNSVSMISACNGWAVGANGRVLHYTDTDWSQNQSNNSGPGNQSGWTPSFPNDPQTGNLPPIGIHFNPLSSGMNPSIVSVKNANRARSIAEWGLNGGEMSTAVPASNTIDRFWDVTQSGGSSMNAVLTLRFNATDVPVGMTNPLSQLQYAYFKHGVYPWTTLPVTSVTGPVNGVYTATVQNVADFSYWTLGGAPLALPVEMTSLSANSGDGRVQLTWRTESETGNDHFNIYRSTSRSDLGELVAQVNGHGTTAISHDYSYNDFRVSNQNRYFYRIADIDLNGTERLHSSIVEAYPTAEVRASIPIKYKLGQNFPNPFNPTTEISYGLKAAGNVYLLISDVQGRVITTLVNSYQTANTYRVVFDATGLPTGTYYYTLTTNGFTTTKKMVLMK
ncbi:MAG: YCF48-related protein, partial [bacterium]|nr:YCF48-related protein [bacterium]